MSDAASQATPSGHGHNAGDHDDHDGNHDGHDNHAMKLWPFFLALLALTAAEVGLYEAWQASAETLADGSKSYFIPKFALVWLILVFTLPKAYIVFVYFMHIRFEKAFIVVLAVIPLLVVFICVLPTLTDTATLKERQFNPVTTMKQDQLRSHGEHHDHAHDKQSEKAKDQ